MHREMSRKENEEEAKRLGLSICKQYDYTIEQMIELQKTLDSQTEGFVVLFSDGLRVKIKGDEYLRMSKILNSLNPISVWGAMKNGKVEEKYMMQLPEELRPEIEKMRDILEKQYQDEMLIIQSEVASVPGRTSGQEDADYFKTVGLWLKNNADKFKYKSAIFPCLRGKPEAVDKLISEKIRPAGNVL